MILYSSLDHPYCPTLRFSINIRYIQIYRYTGTDIYRYTDTQIQIDIYRFTSKQLDKKFFWSTNDINTIQAYKNCNIPWTAMRAREREPERFVRYPELHWWCSSSVEILTGAIFFVLRLLHWEPKSNFLFAWCNVE